MRILITGAGGFVGSRLARVLIDRGEVMLTDGTAHRINELRLFDVAAPPIPSGTSGPSPRLKVIAHGGDIADTGDVAQIMADGVDIVVHLAAIVSGEAEEKFDLGYRVNADGTRALLEASRKQKKPPLFIFSSSTAAYGGELPDPVPDNLRPTPTTSYGIQKVMGELLVSDYSRKGYVDGRALRFPTISVRPGKPNRALSSFVSSIIRDPLQGREAVCPVEDGVRVFILSPRALIRNILHALTIPGESLGDDRAFTLPGLSVTVGEMIRALREIAGEEVVRRIRHEIDPLVAKVVSGWPADVSATRARSLGFAADGDVGEIINGFIEDELGGKIA